MTSCKAIHSPQDRDHHVGTGLWQSQEPIPVRKKNTQKAAESMAAKPRPKRFTFVPGSTPREAAIGPHHPGGWASRKNLRRCSGSSVVRSETPMPAAVARTAMTNNRMASSSTNSSRGQAARSETIMQASSPQALIRHQSQRRTRTTPMPAPRRSAIFHALSIEVSCVITSIEITRMIRLDPRATHTSVRGLGSLLSHTWQISRL